MKRIRIYVSGVVQGVFFRHHTREQAVRLGVTGWVRNLPDGRVEVLVEGEDEAVDRLVAYCRKGPPGAQVTRIQIDVEKWTGEFKDFAVKR